MKKLNNSLRLTLLGVGGFVLFAIFLSSCKKSNDTGYNTPVAALMAFNLAPDKSGLGISLSGSNLTNVPLNYTSFTGNYLNIFPGSRDVAAYDFNTGNPVASVTQNFEANKYYSLFTLGANGVYRNVIVEDKLDSLPVGTGKAYIRYINAVPDSTAPVVVTFTANGTDITSDDAAYGSVSAFTSINPGDVVVKISNGTTINVSRTIAFENAKVYTILLAGKPGDADPAKAVQIKYITNGTIQ